jgi:hypothetical protein
MSEGELGQQPASIGKKYAVIKRDTAGLAFIIFFQLWSIQCDLPY